PETKVIREEIAKKLLFHACETDNEEDKQIYKGLRAGSPPLKSDNEEEEFLKRPEGGVIHKIEDFFLKFVNQIGVI
ncbi:hypothetical protein KEM48_001436, partial [Puccinia striiformis f. sp. tritici PST-130]